MKFPFTKKSALIVATTMGLLTLVGQMAYAQTRTYELSDSVTLREIEEIDGRDVLVKVSELPAGTVLKLNLQRTIGAMEYKDGSGIRRSRRGWIRGIVLESVPGDTMNSSRIAEVNALPLAISVSERPKFELAGSSSNEDSTSGSSPVERDDSDLRGCYNQFVRAGVPRRPLNNLAAFYERNPSRIPNKNYVSLADYSQRSTKKRFYLMNLNNCTVRREFVAHGSGNQGGVKRGDPNHDGMLDRCVYRGKRKNMTRPGMMIVRDWHWSGQTWPVLSSNGAKGLKLHSLEQRNDDVYRQAVVMHERQYVHNSAVVQGRSYGCPAFAPGILKNILRRTSGQYNKGTLFYAHAPQCN